MKKKLNTGAIANELEGASLFFAKTQSPSVSPEIPKAEATPPSVVLQVEKEKPKPKRPVQKSQQSSNRDTTTPRNHETTVSRYHDTIIEIVRKAVKELGKEAATHRFTQEEKNAIADILYTYKSQGVRTSENEITRIAVNFIIEDYRQNGKESVLDKALNALNR
jgi:hypothetical protein